MPLPHYLLPLELPDTLGRAHIAKKWPCRPHTRSGARYSALPHCSRPLPTTSGHLKPPQRAQRDASTCETRQLVDPLLPHSLLPLLARAPWPPESSNKQAHTRAALTLPAPFLPSSGRRPPLQTPRTRPREPPWLAAMATASPAHELTMHHRPAIKGHPEPSLASVHSLFPQGPPRAACSSSCTFLLLLPPHGRRFSSLKFEQHRAHLPPFPPPKDSPWSGDHPHLLEPSQGCSNAESHKWPTTSPTTIKATVTSAPSGRRDLHHRMRRSALSSPIGGAPRETAGGAGYRRTSVGMRSASPLLPRAGGRGRPPRQLAGGRPISGRGDRAGPPVGLSGNGFGPIRLPRWVAPSRSAPSASPPPSRS
nr:formin-like protein 20 [Aegilops tauschii subsp. strangulata]